MLNHRPIGEIASSNQPQVWFVQEMIRRVAVSDYLTINCHAALVPHSTMY
jgi:hypothetical protein